jgi:hypothetical protein
MGTTLERTDATSRIHPALHIDILADGQRIEDRLFDHQRRVSVGRSGRNTVVLPDPEAPRSLPLFHRRGKGYALHFSDRTQGSVAPAPDALWRYLDELREESAHHHRGFDLPLEIGARGRVDVGAETVLFEVLALPDRPRAAVWRWLVGALLLLAAIGFGVWAATRPAPPPASWSRASALTAPRAQPTLQVPATTQPAQSTPALTKSAPQQLPAVRLAAHSRTRPTASQPRSRDDVALTGTLRASSPLVPPLASTAPALAQPDELTLGSPSYTSDGLLRPEVIVRELTLEKGGIKKAYQRALRRQPDLAGDLVARVVVDRDGSVAKVTIVRDTVGSPELRRSVQSLLSTWHAPLPAAQKAEYEVPFHFRATHSSRAR